MKLVHASCVAVDGKGVLLRGPSGSGKSDLALRLIDAGAELVADDYVELTAQAESVRAAPPDRLAGLIEVRGLGLVRLPHRSRVALRLVVDLVPTQAVERLPDATTETLAGIELPRLLVAAHDISAPAKIRLMLRLVETPEGGDYGLEPL